MYSVVLLGWRPGLHKIALDELLRQEAGLSLRQALDCVNRCLAGETVRIPMPTREAAAAVAQQAEQLGAIAAVEPATIEQQV